MATQFSLYNGALRLLKQRRLASTLDDSPARYLLDEVYVDALNYTMEQGLWNFASVSTSLSAASNANRGYTNRATKPAGFVRLISISDSTAYYPPLEAYAEDRDYLFCNVANLYVVHTSRLAASATVTITIASPGVVTHTGHGLVPNAPYAITTSGALPTGLTAGTTYYVKTVLTADTFTLSASPGGTVINTSGSQSGTHTGQAQFGGNLTKWPETYARAVEAYLAQQIAPHLTNSDGIVARATDAYESAIQLSLAKDAINRTMRVISATTLSLYNGALRLLGQRLLANFDDDVVLSRVADPTGEPPSQQSRGRPATLPSLQVGREMSLRRLLDEAYDGAVGYCLEQAQWTFAARATSVSTTATPGFGYARRGTKPSDLVRLIAMSASSSYYPPLESYAEDGALWYTAESTLYLTYVSNDASYGLNTALWPETFAKLVETQLALEIVPSLAPTPDLLKYLDDVYEATLQEARAKDAINRVARVVSSATLSVYNGALRLLGKRLLNNFDDATVSSRKTVFVDGKPVMMAQRDVELEMTLRRLLDECYDQAVDYMLAQGLWNFASRTLAIEEDTAVEPVFGYNYAFEKPTDFIRLVAIGSNGDLYPTLDDYLDEGNYWNANVTPLYVQYISNDASYGLDTSLWPVTFTKALEAYLAKELAPHAGLSAAKMKAVDEEYAFRIRDARSKDAMNQAAMRPPPGRLVRSRGGSRYSDQRRQN